MIDLKDIATRARMSASKTTKDITIYVDVVNGNDTTGDGTASAPYKTMNHAVASLPDLIIDDVVIAVSGNGTDTTAVNLYGKNILGTLTIKAMDTSNVVLYDDGTASSGTSTTLTDSSKSWATDAFAGGTIWIWRGTGAGQYRDISSNTATEITVSTSWATTPDSTSQYAIGGIPKLSITGGKAILIPQGLKNFYISGIKIASSASTDDHETIRVEGPGTSIALDHIYLSSDRTFNVAFGGYSSIDLSFLYAFHSVHVTYEGIGVLSHNLLLSNTTGSGQGIVGDGAGVVLFSALSANSNFIKDFDIGASGQNFALARSLSVQTFNGCTTNISWGTNGDDARYT